MPNYYTCIFCGSQNIIKQGQGGKKACDNPECQEKWKEAKRTRKANYMKDYDRDRRKRDYDQFKKLKQEYNGRYCQRCKKIGKKTKLKGANRFNCPACNDKLSRIYNLTPYYVCKV